MGRRSSRDQSNGGGGGKRKKREITEEEILEYMSKKAQKKAMKVAKSMAVVSAGYSNDDDSNPFGDSINLGEIKFVWRKKIERDVASAAAAAQGRGGTQALVKFSVKSEKKRQRERMAEIEKVKKRREERAMEKARHEEEMALLARERARALQDLDWEKKEEEFCFEQTSLRSQIRVREGRTKPIDILRNSDGFDIVEPYSRMVFKLGITTVKEMEELRDDIKLHLEFDTAHIKYWEALMVLVCDWELAAEASLLLHGGGGGERRDEKGMHPSIEADVESLLEGKTSSELEDMQRQIESEMRSGTAMVVEYWEAILKRLPIYKAKASLKEIHADNLLLRRGRKKHLIEPVPFEAGSFSPQQQLMMPKYFNRVHTSYMWNTYNRTHYDHDNPPPKLVHGYKFEIFFPDLVDKSKVPTFTLDKEEDDRTAETCIIRFCGGPPYQDIAFRIVNKKWEYSHKGGFKCAFETGVLRLYFNFKRHTYRR